MASAQFGVGCDGRLALLAGSSFPGSPVLRGDRECCFALLVGIVHCLGALTQRLQLGGSRVVAAQLGRGGLSQAEHDRERASSRRLALSVSSMPS
jgi:hypothetical protein